MKLLIEHLEKNLNKYGDKYIIDKQKLTEGLYIKINKDFEILDYINIKNGVEISEDDLYYFFLERVFYSKMIFSNASKAIDTKEKKIHSTNPFSIILKRENLKDEIVRLSSDNLKDVTAKGLPLPKTGEEIFALVMFYHFNRIKEMFGDGWDHEKMHKGFNKLLMEDILDFLEDNKLTIGRKVPIYILMDRDLEDYRECSEIYLRQRLFDADKDGLGINIYSNTLNSDKPFLSAVGTSFEKRNLVDYEEAYLYYKLSFVFKDIAKELGYVVETEQKNHISVVGDMAPKDSRNKVSDFREMKILQEDEVDIEPLILKYTRDDILKRINSYSRNIFYALLNRDTKGFRETAGKSIKDASVIRPLVSHNVAIKNYFNQGLDVSIERPLERFTENMFIYDVEKSVNKKIKKTDITTFDLRRKWDLRISIMNYLSNKEVYENMPDKIKEIKCNVEKQFLEKEDIEIGCDESYYFLLGQAFQYLVSKSESSRDTGRFYTPIMRAGNNKKLKEVLINTHTKYSNKLSKNPLSRINVLLAAIYSYEPEKTIKDVDMRTFLHGGLVSRNLIYVKKEKE